MSFNHSCQLFLCCCSQVTMWLHLKHVVSLDCDEGAEWKGPEIHRVWFGVNATSLRNAERNKYIVETERLEREPAPARLPYHATRVLGGNNRAHEFDARVSAPFGWSSTALQWSAAVQSTVPLHCQWLTLSRPAATSFPARVVCFRENLKYEWKWLYMK